MKTENNELIKLVKILIKEVVDLKRESTKNFLLNKRVYTVKEASLVSGVSLSFIYTNINVGRLKHTRPAPKKIMIRRYDLHKFLKNTEECFRLEHNFKF